MDVNYPILRSARAGNGPSNFNNYIKIGVTSAHTQTKSLNRKE